MTNIHPLKHAIEDIFKKKIWECICLFLPRFIEMKPELIQNGYN